MLNNNYYDAEDCHCGIPILELGTKLCSECKRAECGKGSIDCIIFHKYRSGALDRAAARNHRSALIRTPRRSKNGTHQR